MYKYLHNLLPVSVTIKFELRQDIHTHNTRNCNKLQLYRCGTSHRQSSIEYIGPKLWNNLPDFIKKSQSFAIFKSSVKQQFITTSNRTDDI